MAYTKQTRRTNQQPTTHAAQPVVVKTAGPPEMDWDHFSPLQVEVGPNFDRSFKTFRQMVQSDGVLALYRAKQSYEKPSVKKRRKSAEAQKRVADQERKMEKVRNGTYEKERAKKLVAKEKREKARLAQEATVATDTKS